jgi:hypothetical protein
VFFSSFILFFGVNGFQHKLNAAAVMPANLFVGLYPSIAFIGREFFACTERSISVQSADYSPAWNAIQIVPTLLLPLMVYYIAGNTNFHTKVCTKLHEMEFEAKNPSAPAKSASWFGTKLNSDVTRRANDAIAAANRALNASSIY